MEGIIKRLQRELGGARTQSQERQKKIDRMRSSNQYCLNKVGEIAKYLVDHASSKQSYSQYIGCTDTASYLAALQRDTSAHCCSCTAHRIEPFAVV